MKMQPTNKLKTDLLGTEIYEALREIGYRIEICGASEELTHAVTLVSDLRLAVGNEWNTPDKSAANRVRKALLHGLVSVLKK